MVTQIGGVEIADYADTVCKMSLLRPGAFEMDSLPIQTLRDTTKNPRWEGARPYFTAICALVSYREGDPQEANRWATMSGESGRPAGSLALLIRAMSEQKPGKSESALALLVRAEAMIPLKLRSLDASAGDGSLPVSEEAVGFDWQVAEIIRREARTVIDASTK